MSVKTAINFRKAIKIYQTNNPIEESDIEQIIEAGLLAPSSMGIEPTQVIVIRNPEIKSLVADNGFLGSNIKLVKDADTIFILTVLKAQEMVKHEFIKSRVSRRPSASPEQLEAWVNGAANYLQNHTDLDKFAEEQAYITVAFMALQAADLNIGSSILGGFHEEKLKAALSDLDLLDPKSKNIAITLAIGNYDENNSSTSLSRVRMSVSEFAKWVK